MTAAPELIIAGRIASLAGDAGPGWVEALAVSRGRVLAAGSLADVEALAGPETRRLVLAPDEAAIPGLTDAHLHVVSAALARQAVDLAGTRTPDELVERVRAFAEAHPGADRWIEGAGWDADMLGRWPASADLERAAPGRLVALWAHDHHALLVSGRALREAGVDDATDDPDGGVIRRDDHGRASGVLHESATRLVAVRVAPPGVEAIAEAVTALGRELVGLGVVAAHDPGGLTPVNGLGPSFAAYRALAASGSLPLRIHASIRPEQLDAAIGEGLRSGSRLGPDPLARLRMGWIKLFADGTLGSRTAALLEPLGLPPGESLPPNDGFGVWITTPRELWALASRAAGVRITAQIHAIGDAAVRAALDVLGPTSGRTALMPRVEHVQLVADADVPRFAQLGVAASMQPIHVRSDAAKARRLWGPRAEARAYALDAVARTGAVLAAGTDAPVEPVNPWPGIACAVTRSSPDWGADQAPFGPEQALDLWRSVRSWCVGPAVSAGERHERGRLIKGHRADIVVVPAAALTEPVEVDGPLWNARPRLVLMDGEVVAER